MSENEITELKEKDECSVVDPEKEIERTIIEPKEENDQLVNEDKQSNRKQLNTFVEDYLTKEQQFNQSNFKDITALKIVYLLLIFLAVLAIAYIIIYLNGNGEVPVLNTITTSILTFLGAVVGYLFGTKSK